MERLTANEKDVLQRIKDKPELQPLFFSKAKGLKWFDALDQEGYFDPAKIPDVVAADEEGYFRVPRWDAVEYLLKTAPELAACPERDYPERFLSIVGGVTKYAKKAGVSNYQVWFRFAEILCHVPVQYISIEHLDAVDYWLDDQFDRGLVAETLATKWLPELLSHDDGASLAIALRVIELLLRVNFAEDPTTGDGKIRAVLRFQSYHSEKVLNAFSSLSGHVLTDKAVAVFHDKFVEALENLGNDKWSRYWQPAVEDHEQNKYHDDAENILLEAFRDSLDGCVERKKGDSLEYLKELLNSPFETVNRVAIFVVNKHFVYVPGLTNSLLEPRFFQANYRHEIWHFLHQHYTSFNETQKEKVVAIINALEVLDEGGRPMLSACAYQRAAWFAAIRHAGIGEEEFYCSAIETAGAEPEHPDFTSYMTRGVVEAKSPISFDELSGKSPEALVDTLNNFHPAKSWPEPGRAGLARSFKGVIKGGPLKYLDVLDVFLRLDLPYVYVLIQAYGELWSEKSKLPWADVWPKLLSFTTHLTETEQFWADENNQDQADFVANRKWVVASIAQLLEAAVKDDDYAVPLVCHFSIFRQLEVLLNNQPGEVFSLQSDAVGLAINSARGQCIEALINLALRECRVADRESEGGHGEIWKRYLPLFESELDLTDNGQYEFAALLPNYFLNFLYMSKDWVLKSLPRLFSKTDEIKWSCAVQGYADVNRFIKEIYLYLRDNGDFERVLFNRDLPETVINRVIQNASIAYISEIEDIESKSSLLRDIIEHGSDDDIASVIWFFWTQRHQKDERVSAKVLVLWPLILKKIDAGTPSGKKLASKLCKWSSFVSKIDDTTSALLAPVVPFADFDHNAAELLNALADISDTQPFEANEIWRGMIPTVRHDYPEKAFKRIFSNLNSQGAAGVRAARQTVDEYLRRGMDRPRQWFNEILANADIS